eukprot:CAMPEP_0119146536 /NCGR_PEP_ID=MMETSP1310-20130426/39049_1 /TAXON_ID=464262 /ORGANISM="Genus nov. species nov., Strain RCC2339" /LENGTH=325 /DNA_ID=CAMNT_0007138445 /DNA_START=323 /DNA_END=1297 /DNA_ORIENTATION=+
MPLAPLPEDGLGPQRVGSQADVRQAQQELHHAPLADASADRVRQVPRQQGPVVRALPPGLPQPAGPQLPGQPCGVHADAHGAELVALLRHWVPHQQVAVQAAVGDLLLVHPVRGQRVEGAPVVVVRSPGLVGLPGAGQGGADADDERRAVLSQQGLLPLLPRLPGVPPRQLLSVDEEHVVGQHRRGARERRAGRARLGLGRLEHLPQVPDGLGEERHGAVAGVDGPLPVPLLHAAAVGAVQGVVPADGAHVAPDAAALGGRQPQPQQAEALPLGGRLQHLPADAAPLAPEVGAVHLHGALHVVQLVVPPARHRHHQRALHALQAE